MQLLPAHGSPRPFRAATRAFPRRLRALRAAALVLCLATPSLARPTPGATTPAAATGSVLGAAASLQGRPKARPAAPTLALFAGNMKAARERARERNVPIVAIALLDEEQDNVDARTELLASAELAALSRRSILFFSNHGAHKTKEVAETVDGKTVTRTVCADFGTATCKEHQQHWDDIYNEYNEDGVLRCPQVLVIAPDGKLEERVAPSMKPPVASIVEAVDKAQAKLGRGLTEEELATVKDALVRATRAEQDGRAGGAWRAFGEVLAISPDGARGETARAGRKRCEEWYAKRRDEAAAKLGEGDGLAGYLALEELAKDWTGTPQAEELTRLMKKAEKEPALRDALAKKRREDEATALWTEAEALIAAKQPKEAEKKIRVLLKKFAGTAAYEKAAKAYPQLVPEKPAGQ